MNLSVFFIIRLDEGNVCMVISVIVGFCIGGLMPIISSRFGKILPADPGMVLLRLFHKPHFPFTPNVDRRRHLVRKWLKLILHSFTWGCLMSILYMASSVFLVPQMGVWGMIFCTIICFCIIVDQQYFLLPDFFTIPLLLMGFSAATFVDDLPIEYSLVGAFFGYFVSVFSVFIMGLIHKAEFGAGDVKMVIALGTWLGAPGLNFTLVLSFMLFALRILLKVKRSGAFGPALGFASLISFFIIYAK